MQRPKEWLSEFFFLDKDMNMEVGQRDSLYNKWEVGDEAKDGEKSGEITFVDSAKCMLFTGSMNVLLLATPIAIISYAAEWPDAVTFIFSLIALAPLAERLGFVTEQLALHTNETIGGLLNATFGNATELIVAITALNSGLFRLVQLSLLGSILSNLLLVLGTALLFGGIRNEAQYFQKISAQINSTLLMLSTMAIIFPTVLIESGNASNLSEVGLSRAVSLVLFTLYFAFLYFQVQ
jgi:Ca2+:H+ antiporter